MQEKNIEEIIPSTSGKLEVIEILNELFINNRVGRTNPISFKIFFDRYFSLALLPSEISEVEFEQAFNDPKSIGENLITLNQKNSQLLAIKIGHKFINYTIIDKDDFTYLFKGFFELYKSVYISTSQVDLIEGINTNNIRTLIADLYKKSTLEDKKSSLDELLNDDKDNYSYLSSLIGLDLVFIIATNENERRTYFKYFRDLQKKYLQRAIEKDDIIITIQIIQQLSRFITIIQNNKANSEDLSWFQNNILIENGSVF